MFSGKVVNGRVAVGITGRISGGMWLLLEVKFLCLFLLLTIPLCLCVGVYTYIYIYMCVCVFVCVRMYNEQVFIVPSSALNLSVCKCNLPVCRYE